MQRTWIQRTVLLMMVAWAAAVCLAAAEKDLDAHPQCPYCGMDRTRFAHSRVLIEYDDGTSVGTCSLHCAALDLALQIDKTPLAIRVGDYDSKRLIDARNAAWVTGGDRMGVMTRRAKWAFASQDAAAAFVQAHGGAFGDYAAALQASFEDMYADLEMIRAKRREMRAHKGS